MDGCGLIAEMALVEYTNVIILEEVRTRQNGSFCFHAYIISKRRSLVNIYFHFSFRPVFGRAKPAVRPRGTPPHGGRQP